MDQGYIPLRRIDIERWPNPMGLSLEGFEPYTAWRATAPHKPPQYSSNPISAQVLDLRGADAVAWDQRTQYPEWHRDREQRRADEALAARFIADDALMPEPEGPPLGAIYAPRGLWRPGGKRPRTAWALVQWPTCARLTCAPFYLWMQAQTAKPDELRIIFGFS
jgi:hypothetical protein